jgi:hypothetical protein
MKNALYILALISIFSCSEIDETNISLEDTSEVCDDSRLTDPNYTGTICCIQRITELNATSAITYRYNTNLANPAISWRVTSGDIEIVSGANTNEVTIQLGGEFSTGRIIAEGVSGDDNSLHCDEEIVITKN